MTHTFTDADLCHVLSCPRRRLALEYLWDADDVVTLASLAEVVAAVEAGETPAPRPLRESVYTSLRQTHLPTLERHGLVAVDGETKQLAATPAAKGAIRRIRDAGLLDVPWSELYRGVGILGLFGVVTALAAVPGLPSVDPLVPAVGALAAYAVASAYHTWTLRPRLARRETESVPTDWEPSAA
jgi:hypothetical protein